MKLSALCCTYLRPAGLGQLIECFLRQDYPRELRELIILDDAGQYENQSGDGWRLGSVGWDKQPISISRIRRGCERIIAHLEAYWQRQLEREQDMLADRKSTRLNSSHIPLSRMPSSA